MARKSREDALKTREALLDAAGRLFREKGVSRTTLDDIAREAGCTRGALYWHFRNKVELFGELVDRVQLPLFDEAATVATRCADPIASLRSFCVEAVRDIERNPQSRELLDILNHRCEFVAELIEVEQRQQARARFFIEQHAAAFRRGHGLGLIRSDLDPDLCAVMLHALIVGLIRTWLMAADGTPLGTRCTAAIDLLLQGFGYATPPP